MPVVVLFDELFEMGAQLVDVLVLVGADLFALEGFDKALAGGIVVGCGGAAHAGQDGVVFEHVEVLLRRILDAAVGVVHQAGRGLAQDESWFQGRQREARRQAAVQRPANHFAGEAVPHQGQVMTRVTPA